MSLNRIEFSFTCVACSAILLAAAPQQDSTSPALAQSPASPTFDVASEITLTFPIAGAAGEPLSFLLRSKGGRIIEPSVEVSDIRDPLNQPRDHGMVSVEALPAELTEKRVQVKVKPDRSKFGRPGDYQILLQFTGTATDATQQSAAVAPASVKLIVRRPQPELNTDEWKDMSVRLVRPIPCPCWPAAGSAVIALRETTGKADVSDVSLRGGPVFEKDSKVQSSGSASASFSGQVKSNSIDAGTSRQLEVRFSGFGFAGSFTTQVAVESISLGGEKLIPLKLLVTDFWLWPLLAILLGVVGAYYVHTWSGDWKSRRLNTYNIVRLRGLVDRHMRLVRRQAKIDSLREIKVKLEEADDRNRLGDFAGSANLITQARTMWDDFCKLEVTAKANVWNSVAEFEKTSQFYKEERGNAATDADRAFFEHAKDTLDTIEELLARDAVDESADELAVLQARLDELKKQALKEHLDVLKQRLDALPDPPVTAADKQPIDGEIAGTRQQVDTDFELAKRATAAIEQKIRALQQRVANLAPADAVIVSRWSMLANSAQRMQSAPRIRVVPAPAERTTDTPVRFSLEPPVAAGTELEWHFGAGKPVKRTDARVSHQYSQAGEYRVQVKAINPPTALPNLLATRVTILPGRTEQKLQDIEEELRWANLAVSLVAVVLAALTGMLYLYVNKQFGSFGDYCGAILWGFGIDNTLRGFGPVYKKITSLTA
jgi:hypothetical protein